MLFFCLEKQKIGLYFKTIVGICKSKSSVEKVGYTYDKYLQINKYTVVTPKLRS